MVNQKNNTDPLIPVTPAEQQVLSGIKKTFKSLLHTIMENNNQLNAKFDLATVWPETDDLPTLYSQLTDLKHCLDSFRPIAPETIMDMQESWDIQYTYESNRIEGNSLTLDETLQVIEKGLTIGGKPLNDHLEAINHQDAIHYIRDFVEGGDGRDSQLTERTLLNIHNLILKGIRDRDAGSYRRQPVFILQSDGKRHEFPDAYLLNKLVEDYFIFYNENKDTMHPVEMAAHLHQRLVNIHPFIDGNGRTSRLVMNLHLLQQGYPITIIDSEMDKRQEYYRILGEYRGVAEGDSKPFELFIAQKVKDTLFEYLQFLSADQNESAEDKGYTFFKKIEPYLS
ncbi:MAG: Fic family protein [Candidatus Thiodiazotropha sp. (ex Lucinoma aequizonata)]|nr:Fic family protein [Candidatus Thiodiazotropha sp. (ex Lucinoma aequizonata)]MCU7889898.1 Fic family protein [Candidatus Thiodiazotropha sp. (ex Lucinoma aequizonata)]MCU7894717.1 Fic family protein [Candidatus Thiodiazotropha sp. (ex Lucinoma aequizonata)]MCU7897664.1 Fic family protein [Candidatus Thiodiazotropha sp. (ex Lucinoma aequizonata)]MCU7901709.1 Fic family protein [Candidatus Thiodiazotropha sp. (ex Lucinoma aequizonata)]